MGMKISKLTGKSISPSTMSDSEQPAGPNRVDDGAIKGSEGANSIGVFAASGDASEGGGGVVMMSQRKKEKQ